MKANGISISEGNTKTGSVPSVSLLACASCPKDVPCTRDCYVVRNMYWRSSTKKAHKGNLVQAKREPEKYFGTVSRYVAKKKPRLFRWHISGDMLSQDYLNNVKAVAIGNPATRYLAFTKYHTLNWKDKPDNLTVVYSMWPGWGDADAVAGPRAWMQDGTEDRVPADALECPGNCESCGMCWALPSLGRDVVFHKH